MILAKKTCEEQTPSVHIHLFNQPIFDTEDSLMVPVSLIPILQWPGQTSSYDLSLVQDILAGSLKMIDLVYNNLILIMTFLILCIAFLIPSLSSDLVYNIGTKLHI